jgi:hypothetical protein
MDYKDLDPAQVEERRAAMMAAVGIWKDRTDLPDTETYIRNLRGTRIQDSWPSGDETNPDSDEER